VLRDLLCSIKDRRGRATAEPCKSLWRGKMAEAFGKPAGLG
jgi:hypothetical protein